MKKEYESPKAEKMEFNYSETVTASSGHLYQLFVDGYEGCHTTPTDKWVNGDTDSSCSWS